MNAREITLLGGGEIRKYKGTYYGQLNELNGL